MKKGYIAIAIIAMITACSKNKEVPATSNNNPIDCSGAAKTFTANVRPIIEASCSGCHGTGSGNGPGALTSYTEIFNARAAIRSAVLSGAMPQGGTLSSAEKNSIICWIDNGSPNN